MERSYYSDSIESFLITPTDQVLGVLASNNEFSLEPTQRYAWQTQIAILKQLLFVYEGSIYFEYAIPRMGRRIDAVLLIGPAIFVLEFKVGEREFKPHAIDQVWDYALDLKNFHETSHKQFIAPILVATEAQSCLPIVSLTHQSDLLLSPITTNASVLGNVIESVLSFVEGDCIDRDKWESGKYRPTPTIIEAAKALYNNHSVTDISRSDASAINLSRTSEAIDEIIRESKSKSKKVALLCDRCPWCGQNPRRAQYCDQAHEQKR